MLDTRRSGDILEIRLARPPVNALNPELLTGLRDAVRSAPGDGARGIVIAGGPKVFSAGLDVPHLLTLDRPDLEAAWRVFFEAAHTIAASPVPVVAAIAGHCPAGGCVLALCCDYRVMAEGDFRIGLNEVEVGLAVPEGIQHLMRRVIGPYRAERLLVSGAMVDAATAHGLGLVDELAPAEAVDARAQAWLAELLRRPAAPMLATRRLARADLVEALEDPVRAGVEGFIEGWYAPQTQAVLKALVERLKGGKPG